MQGGFQLPNNTEAYVQDSQTSREAWGLSHWDSKTTGEDNQGKVHMQRTGVVILELRAINLVSTLCSD